MLLLFYNGNSRNSFVSCDRSDAFTKSSATEKLPKFVFSQTSYTLTLSADEGSIEAISATGTPNVSGVACLLKSPTTTAPPESRPAYASTRRDASPRGPDVRHRFSFTWSRPPALQSSIFHFWFWFVRSQGFEDALLGPGPSTPSRQRFGIIALRTSSCFPVSANSQSRSAPPQVALLQ